MGNPLVTNNAYSTLASSISDTDTSLSVQSGHGGRFPSISGSDYFYATLIDTSNNMEIVKVTARSTDTFTITRAQDSTTARAFSASDRIELRPVAALFEDVLALATGVTDGAKGDITVSSSGSTWTITQATLAALRALTGAANKIAMFTSSTAATLLDFKDEDNMASNSATAVPSQQSVKAYVDGLTFSLLDEDDMASNSAVAAPSQQSVKAYVDDAVAAGGGPQLVRWGYLDDTAFTAVAAGSTKIIVHITWVHNAGGSRTLQLRLSDSAGASSTAYLIAGTGVNGAYYYTIECDLAAETFSVNGSGSTSFAALGTINAFRMSVSGDSTIVHGLAFVE